MDFTIIQQGRFTSNGSPQTLVLRSDVDWVWVFNYTEANSPDASNGVVFYWQRGLANGDGFVDVRNAGATADLWTTSAALAVGGFSLVDSSAFPLGAQIAETAITNAVQPVVTTANTAGLGTGSVVRLNSDTGVPNLMGFDFEVDTVIANTSFRMRWALANAPGAVGAGNGFYRQVIFQPLFYPRRRFVVNITQAAQAVVRLSVAHQFTVGQQIRFVIPPEFGMVEMDGLVGNIVAISTVNNTITVDIDSSTFTAFTFPLVADFPFNWAQAVPLGEDTSTALLFGQDILADATINTGFIGIILAAGITGPAGEDGDIIFWRAGKSFSVENL